MLTEIPTTPGHAVVSPLRGIPWLEDAKRSKLQISCKVNINPNVGAGRHMHSWADIQQHNADSDQQREMSISTNKKTEVNFL